MQKVKTGLELQIFDRSVVPESSSKNVVEMTEIVLTQTLYLIPGSSPSSTVL